MTLIRPLLVLLALLATIAMNAAANLVPLNGRSTGTIADAFQIYITPAGYVFSIWSLIYAGLIAYAIYQLTPAGRSSPRIRGIALPFIVTCLANIAWLAYWHFGYYAWTLPTMLVLLAALVVIYVRLAARPAASPAERWCVDYPFRLYTGWITVATLVNLSVVLEALDARPAGLSAEQWAVLMVGVAASIGVIVGRRRRDLIYLTVIAWALIGVALKTGQPATVSLAAWAGTAVVAGTAAWAWLSARDKAAARPAAVG